MFVAAVGAFQAFFYHYLHYSPFLCGFQCFGKFSQVFLFNRRDAKIGKGILMRF